MKDLDKLFHIGIDIAYLLSKFGGIKIYNVKIRYETLSVEAAFGLDWEFVYSFKKIPLDFYTPFFKLVNFLDNLVIPYQRLVYRLTYLYIIKKYPEFKDHIIYSSDYNELLVGIK